MGCRFIALNDGVDTLHKNNEMIAILKNVMNDLYARDTSNKIKAVIKSSMTSGKYVASFPPLGYMKDPENKHKLIPNPTTAPIVRRIFDMRIQGYSFRKIAKALNEDGIPNPRNLHYALKGETNPRKQTEHWNDLTVAVILRNEVYLGNLVQNRTGCVSYKVHKQIKKPEEEWIRVNNTHEPLISQETWDAVRRMDNHPSKGRSCSDGEISPFAGILYCMDCGGAMRLYKRYDKEKKNPPQLRGYSCNQYLTTGTACCSPHNISYKILTDLLRMDICYKATLAQNCPDTLREKILKQKNAANLEQTKTIRVTIAALDKRLAELDTLLRSTYEDKVKNLIPEDVCIQLINHYEAERKTKLEQRKKLSSQLEASQEDEKSTDDWLTLIRDYAELETLDRPTLLRLINRIEVGEKYKLDGKTHRDIKIYYNFVGYVEV
jgi:hypothetical protein